MNIGFGTHPNTVLRVILPWLLKMVKKIGQLLLVTLPIKRAWSFSGISQRIDNLAHITSYSLGSNYPKTIELSSPKLNAYKS